MKKELVQYINKLFTEEALKRLADYRIVAHQPLTESNVEMFADIISKGMKPENIFLLPTAATYNDNLAEKAKSTDINFMWNGWINKTTKYNEKYDRWYNCMDQGDYINADCNNANHLFARLLNGKFQNTVIIDSEKYVLPDVDNHIRVTEYNKKCIYGISNHKVNLNELTHIPTIDVGISRWKFRIGYADNTPEEDALVSALTLGAVYSIFQKDYERETLSKLAEKNTSIVVPERMNRFRPQQLDLNIEDNIVKEYQIWYGS